MDITCVFFLGFVIAIISVLPPGLLNMSAAKISLDEGRSRGFSFSLGASLVVLIQTYIAAIFARYLSKNTEVIEILRIVAFVLFVIITIYFLFIAKVKEKTKESKRKGKKSSFFNGMFLSVLNVLPVPYQAYMTITLASYGWITFSLKDIFTYTAGVGIGSLITFCSYVMFFKKIKSKKFTSPKNMNYIIGIITGVIAIITFINIIS